MDLRVLKTEKESFIDGDLFLKYTTSVNILYKPYATLFLVFDISKNYNEVPFLCIKFTIGFVLSASALNENIHIQ